MNSLIEASNCLYPFYYLMELIIYQSSELFFLEILVRYLKGNVVCARYNNFNTARGYMLYTQLQLAFTTTDVHV